jgi:hypothetical protein
MREPSTIIQVGSFLTGRLDEQLQAIIASLPGYHYVSLDIRPTKGKAALDLTDESAHSFAVPAGESLPDIVLLPTTSCDLTHWCEQVGERTFGPFTRSGDLSQKQPAVIAVLCDDSVHDAVRAAQLDFDGILAAPFNAELVEQGLAHATALRDRRMRLISRHNKLRGLCRNINVKRRHLRQKVDLLCQDLVKSNGELNHRVEKLRSAYDFQSSLSGQFDLHYMLNKALQQIKNQFAESSAAIYLCETGLFEAHLAGSWYDDPRDIADLEASFSETAVAKIFSGAPSVLVEDAGEWPAINAQLRHNMLGLSLLALPVTTQSGMAGVIILYRSAGKPFAPSDRITIAPYLPPLGQSIESLLKLQQQLATP